MNLTALTLLGLAAGAGQPAADVSPMKTRAIALNIDYDPARKKDIEKVVLYASRGDGTWMLAASAFPNEDTFKFTAPEDGVYWFNMVTVYRNGDKEPPDVSRVPPAVKYLLDATAPVVRVTNARRDGDDVFVQWDVEEKFPDEKAVQVTFKTNGVIENGWQTVPAESVGRRAAKFKPGNPGPITVQVTVADLAGNQGSTARDVKGSPNATAYAGGTVNPAAGTLPPAPVMNFAPEPTLPAGGPALPSGPITPVIPPPTLPVEAPASIPPPAAPAPAAPAPVSAPATPTFTATTNWSPAGAPPPPEAAAPIAVGAGQAAPVPTETSTGVQVIRSARFDLQYQVENGPSGLSRIDLYVTRDDGRTWMPWSQHSGQESPLRVVLDTDANRKTLEGHYGFRLVPVSGVGLADTAPAPGTPPEMRVLVDLTMPSIWIYPPKADPAQRNVLVLRWRAEDANFGREPVAIEWSESQYGPWLPVTGGGGVAQVVGGQSEGPTRVANTGSYPWQLPAGMGTHKVYLRVSAWDAAGNRNEAVTTAPVLVDLTKPRAKIQGFANGLPR